MNLTRPEPLDIVLIARPSCRTLAYCSVMREEGVFPRQVVWLQGDIPFISRLKYEDQRYGYSRQYYDLNLEPLEWLRSCGSNIHLLGSDDVNAPDVLDVISRCEETDLLFSASGIVAPETLATGKRFIHVHPGLLPAYRGSTCFYYSILEEGTVAASAFIMNVNIDDGQLLASSSFTLNLHVDPDQHLFMDHILDPYIRSRVLARILRLMRSGAVLQEYPNRKSQRPVCYVMHPILRHLAVKRLNGNFNQAEPNGLTEYPYYGEDS